jgi:transposase
MRPAIERLDTIPGIARQSAEQIIAELGNDMQRFATAGHAASWTGICPGNHESAGKRRQARTTKDNRWLRATLVECARGAVRKRDSYFAAQNTNGSRNGMVTRRRLSRSLMRFWSPRGTFSAMALSIAISAFTSSINFTPNDSFGTTSGD